MLKQDFVSHRQYEERVASSHVNTPPSTNGTESAQPTSSFPWSSPMIHLTYGLARETMNSNPLIYIWGDWGIALRKSYLLMGIKLVLVTITGIELDRSLISIYSDRTSLYVTHTRWVKSYLKIFTFVLFFLSTSSVFHSESRRIKICIAEKL